MQYRTAEKRGSSTDFPNSGSPPELRGRPADSVGLATPTAMHLLPAFFPPWLIADQTECKACNFFPRSGRTCVTDPIAIGCKCGKTQAIVAIASIGTLIALGLSRPQSLHQLSQNRKDSKVRDTMHFASTADILASISDDMDSDNVFAADLFETLIYHRDADELGFDEDWN